MYSEGNVSIRGASCLSAATQADISRNHGWMTAAAFFVSCHPSSVLTGCRVIRVSVEIFVEPHYPSDHVAASVVGASHGKYV